MPDLILLPTARLVAPELQTEFGPIPPALVPLEGRPAFDYITDTARREQGRVVLAGHDGADLLEAHLTMRPLQNVALIDVGVTSSLGETVLEALRCAPPRDEERLVINFADTFVADLPTDGDVVCFRRQDDIHRWTTFDIDEHGMVTSVVDKDLLKNNSEGSNVFVGVFAFTDWQRFFTHLERACTHTRDALEPFFHAVVNYVNELPSELRNLHEVDVWHDFGHLDTYYRTRQQFFLNKRFFNDVEVDPRRGLIRKTSANETKLRREIEWYRKIPPAVQHVGPRIFDTSTEPGNVFVDMEFYGYPPLAEAYLHGEWNDGIWAQAFSAMGTVLDDFASFTYADDADAITRALQEMYIDKSVHRLREVQAADHLASMAGSKLLINGKPSYGVAGVLRVLPDVVRSFGLLDRQSLTVVHGDFCLSNILFDRRTCIVRLIDPRGSFGSFDIYGDPLYDYAKLSHSVNGFYDHLVQGMFEFSSSSAGVSLVTHTKQRQRSTRRLFEGWLQKRLGPERDKVALIESLLFLSMVPLHADKPLVQQAFLARGLAQFTRVVRRAELDGSRPVMMLPA